MENYEPVQRKNNEIVSDCEVNEIVSDCEVNDVVPQRKRRINNTKR
jgi:hypothetical protein